MRYDCSTVQPLQKKNRKTTQRHTFSLTCADYYMLFLSPEALDFLFRWLWSLSFSQFQTSGGHTAGWISDMKCCIQASRTSFGKGTESSGKTAIVGKLLRNSMPIIWTLTNWLSLICLSNIRQHTVYGNATLYWKTVYYMHAVVVVTELKHICISVKTRVFSSLLSEDQTQNEVVFHGACVCLCWQGLIKRLPLQKHGQRRLAVWLWHQRASSRCGRDSFVQNANTNRYCWKDECAHTNVCICALYIQHTCANMKGL